MKQISANKLRIISENYKEEVYSTSIKTVCKITYINPLTGVKQVSKGVAKCSKKEYNSVKGYRISEARAKERMYRNYIEFIYYFMFCNVIHKHQLLADNEKEHIKRLIHE